MIFGVWGNKVFLLIKDKVIEDRIIFIFYFLLLSYLKIKNSFKDLYFFKKVNVKLINLIDFSIRKEN